MRFETLAQWLEWQTTFHSRAIDLGLERVRQVWNVLAAPRLAPIVITVAGTNGKGSTVAMLEAILLAAGYRVGAFTSPHLLHYNERIRVQGAPVTDAQICAAFERIDTARGETSLTYFEFGTLAAFEIFQQSPLDVAILEVGLGGRLDAVNIIDSDVAVVTTIALDHTDWLGSTREAIATEKLAIGRAGRPLVLGDAHPPANVDAVAARHGAHLRRIGRDFSYKRDGDSWVWANEQSTRHALPYPSLRGIFQLANAACAIEALSQLAQQLPVSQNDLRRGLLDASVTGRFQVIPGKPIRVLDVAHNPESAQSLAGNLERFEPMMTKIAVLGMLKDKDMLGVITPLTGCFDRWFIGGITAERGASAATLHAVLIAANVSADQIDMSETIDDAYQKACESLQEGVIVVFGSFYTVAQALTRIQGGT